MTIKNFSILCGCSPKTLRYYDSIGLLTPARVDKSSGYRYYDEEQVADFVKIKNLQRAGFSIEEMKRLLDKDDRAIYAAFEQKIQEAEEKLREIQAIRDSYRTEMSEIKKKIEQVKERIAADMRGYDPSAEFGVSPEQYDEIIGNILAAFDGIDLPDDFDVDYEASHGEEPPHDYANDPAYALVYEKHGFENASEFLGEIAPLDPVGDYAFIFELCEEKYAVSEPFMNTLLGLLLQKIAEEKSEPAHGGGFYLYVNTERSADGVNRISLYKKKF